MAAIIRRITCSGIVSDDDVGAMQLLHADSPRLVFKMAACVHICSLVSTGNGGLHVAGAGARVGRGLPIRHLLLRTGAPGDVLKI